MSIIANCYKIAYPCMVWWLRSILTKFFYVLSQFWSLFQQEHWSICSKVNIIFGKWFREWLLYTKMWAHASPSSPSSTTSGFGKSFSSSFLSFIMCQLPNAKIYVLKKKNITQFLNSCKHKRDTDITSGGKVCIEHVHALYSYRIYSMTVCLWNHWQISFTFNQTVQSDNPIQLMYEYS